MSKKEFVNETAIPETFEATVEETAPVTKIKSIVDYMTAEDYARYSELLAKAEEAKANAPKAARAPMTTEQKKKHTENRIAKLQARLAELTAEIANDNTEETADIAE